MANPSLIVTRCFGEAEFLFGFTAKYLPDLSKNRRYIYTTNLGGRLRSNPKHEQAKQLVRNACRSAMGALHTSIPKCRLYVDVVLFKHKVNADVANIVDGLYDAIQAATGVNDYNFSGHIDFEMDKNNPRIEVMIYRRIENDRDST